MEITAAFLAKIRREGGANAVAAISGSSLVPAGRVNVPGMEGDVRMALGVVKSFQDHVNDTVVIFFTKEYIRYCYCERCRYMMTHSPACLHILLYCMVWSGGGDCIAFPNTFTYSVSPGTNLATSRFQGDIRRAFVAVLGLVFLPFVKQTFDY